MQHQSCPGWFHHANAHGHTAYILSPFVCSLEQMNKHPLVVMSEVAQQTNGQLAYCLNYHTYGTCNCSRSTQQLQLVHLAAKTIERMRQWFGTKKIAPEKMWTCLTAWQHNLSSERKRIDQRHRVTGISLKERVIRYREDRAHPYLPEMPVHKLIDALLCVTDILPLWDLILAYQGGSLVEEAQLAAEDSQRILSVALDSHSHGSRHSPGPISVSLSTLDAFQARPHEDLWRWREIHAAMGCEKDEGGPLHQWINARWTKHQQTLFSCRVFSKKQRAGVGDIVMLEDKMPHLILYTVDVHSYSDNIPDDTFVLSLGGGVSQLAESIYADVYSDGDSYDFPTGHITFDVIRPDSFPGARTLFEQFYALPAYKQHLQLKSR